MAYRALVTVILVVHFGYLAYLALGGFLAWRWRWTFWPHFVAAVWGLAVVTLPLHCPLTWAENWARVRGGEPAATRGFIDRYIEGVLYPERYAMLLRILVALLVLGSWLGAYRRLRRPAQSPAGGRAGQRHRSPAERSRAA